MLENDIQKWLTLYKRPNLKATSYDTLVRTVNNYILPILGTMETSEISSEDVMELLYDLEYSRGLSDSTIKKVYDALSEFYRHLLVRGKVEKDIMSSVIRKRNRKSKFGSAPRSLSEVEIKKFINTALMDNGYGEYNYQYGPAMLIYLNTGLRLGELCGLTVDDFDIDSGVLYIHSNVECISKTDSKGNIISGCELIHQETPKSYDSERVLKLNKTAYKYLSMYRKKAMSCKSNYLVCNTKGEMTSPNSIKSTYYHITDRANINNAKGVHTLRHTCATHMLRNGVDIKVVSKILGHASVKVTYDTYIHLFENDIPDAYGVLENVFGTR